MIKRLGTIYLILAIIILLIVSIFFYLYGGRILSQDVNQLVKEQIKGEDVIGEGIDCNDELDIKCWSLYKTSDFSFKYPPGFSIHELPGNTYKFLDYKNRCIDECYIYILFIPMENESFEDIYSRFDDSSSLWLKNFSHSIISETWGDILILNNIQNVNGQPLFTVKAFRTDSYMISVNYRYFNEKDSGKFDNLIDRYDFNLFNVSP